MGELLAYENCQILLKLTYEYNILVKLGSLLSRKHSDETHQKISVTNKGLKKGENHSMYSKTGENNPNYGKPKVIGSGSPSQQIELTDFQENNMTILILLV
jgi:hypothetical protein